MRPEKVAAVEELKQRMEASDLLVFAGFQGVKAGDFQRLRLRFRREGVGLKVVPNRIALRAANQVNEAMGKFFLGETCVAFEQDGGVKAARLLTEFAKQVPQFSIKGAVVRGQVVEAKQVEQLAQLPPREVLLGQVVGAMKSPISGLVFALSGPYRKLLYALSAIKEQKETCLRATQREKGG